MRIFINRLVEQSGSLFDVCSAGCFGSPPRTSKEPLCGHRLRIVLCILHMISYNMYSIHNAKMYIFSSRDRRRLCVHIYIYIFRGGVRICNACWHGNVAQLFRSLVDLSRHRKDDLEDCEEKAIVVEMMDGSGMLRKFSISRGF